MVFRAPRAAGDLRRAAFLCAFSYTDQLPESYEMQVGDDDNPHHFCDLEEGCLRGCSSADSEQGWSWSRERVGLSQWKFITSADTDAQATCCFEGDAGEDGRSGGTCWVAFRGTRGANDILYDLRAEMRTPSFFADVGSQGPNCGRVHLGFLEQFESVREDVMSYIRRVKHSHTLGGVKVTRVVVTGHSLGGALAVLCAAAISSESDMGALRVKCVTFGAPRVGDDAFAAAVEGLLGAEDAIDRVVLGRDPVTRLPLRLTAFRHAGRALLLPSGPGGGPGAWRYRAGDPLWRGALDLPNPCACRDHSLREYVEAVSALCSVF